MEGEEQIIQAAEQKPTIICVPPPKQQRPALESNQTNELVPVLRATARVNSMCGSKFI
jgi:hypothetical protein